MIRSLPSIIVLLAIFGCRTARSVHDAHYPSLTHDMCQASHSPDPVGESISPVLAELEGPHPVEEYIQFALAQNPDIQAARKQMESLARQVPVAGSLQDPNLAVTAFPEQIQTAAGQQELAVAVNQKFPWHGKLQARSALAEAELNAARAALAAVELATIAKVKVAYYEIYFLQQAIKVTETDQKLLVEIRDVANTRYQTGKTSQQDLLRADLEIAKVASELITLRQRIDSYQARLARLLHLSPQTRVRALSDLPQQKIPDDLDQLQRIAVEARPELHAQLLKIQRDRHAVELARLNYLPDVTLGATWIDIASAGISPVANGRDAVLLTAGINLPIYRKRLDSAVRSAEAKAVSSARSYDSLRDETLEEVMDLFAHARSKQQLLQLFRDDILPKARQTLQVSSQAYNADEVDFLQLVDNWRQLLQYEINYQRTEASLRQTLAKLEQTLGGFTPLQTATSARVFDAKPGTIKEVAP